MAEKEESLRDSHLKKRYNCEKFVTSCNASHFTELVPPFEECNLNF